VHNHVIGAGARTKTEAGGGGSARTEEERRIAGRSSAADGIQEAEESTRKRMLTIVGRDPENAV